VFLFVSAILAVPVNLSVRLPFWQFTIYITKIVPKLPFWQSKSEKKLPFCQYKFLYQKDLGRPQRPTRHRQGVAT
jgi:hypothetical protein